MQTVKIFVNSANEGDIVCPKCEKTKTIHLSQARIPHKPIRVKCNCGYSFSIVLEYRKYHRKPVSITGKLIDPQTQEEIAEIVVASLSVVGVGFELKSAASVAMNGVYEIVFTLDDNLDSTIREQIVVKRVNGDSIGAEFFDQEKYNYELDFYIMSQLSLP
jgi:C4-type Zn-finger protein